jgi:hypothetical protein
LPAEDILTANLPLTRRQSCSSGPLGKDTRIRAGQTKNRGRETDFAAPARGHPVERVLC